MQKRWLSSTFDSEKIQTLATQCDLPPLLTKILFNRGFTQADAIQKFLQGGLKDLPDPFLLKDMDKVVTRLVTALRQQEKIVIYGDYDVDGTTATALLMVFFRELGANISFYIPHRIREGYSLNTEALRHLAAQGTRVVISVDNGIAAVAAAELAKDLGLDLIITDHHEAPPILPKAFAILNPKQPDDLFPGKELAGVGVAFYLALALRKTLREASLLPQGEPDLKNYLDLVAVGTVADMAPLLGVNRILVKEGLKVFMRQPRLGLQALLEVAGLQAPISAGQIGFTLGPRINAVGRLNEASLGVQLLLTADPVEARRLAQILNQANQERQGLESAIVQEALAAIETAKSHEQYRSLVVYNEAWHSGVVGIVASRLVEKYHLPSIVLTLVDGKIKGSARSIANLNLVETLRDCSAYLIQFGGHAAAAGLTMAPEALPAFIQAFDQAVRARLKDEDFSPALRLDAESNADAIDPTLLKKLELLEPYGLGNPQPIFCLRSVKVQELRVLKEKHLKLSLESSGRRLGAIGFRMGHLAPSLSPSLDLAFYPEWNEWNHSRNIQLRLIDLKNSEI